MSVPELRTVGLLEFSFGDEHFMSVHVFRAPGVDGEPTETPEAKPLWVPIDAVPYEDMWDDDRYWLPLLFEGRTFRGWFRFDSAAERLRGRFVNADVDV